MAGSCGAGGSPTNPNPGGGESKPRTDETILGWASSSISSISADEQALGAKNGMLSTYVDFVNSPGFPTAYADAAAQRSAPLLIAWEPWDWNGDSLDQPEFRSSDLAAGSYDSYMIEWLKEAERQSAKAPILVRFAPEMNDAVRPWSVGANGGNTAADYIAMWRHVYELKEQHAPSVDLMWNPLVDGSDPAGNPVAISAAFPGESYVDMVALDGFNWGDVQNPAQCGWQSYEDIFKAPVAELKRLAPSKPWGIAETASLSMDESVFQEGGKCYDGWGSWVYQWPESGAYYKTADDWITQAGWTKTMIQQANRDGAMFVNIFNVQKETDWRLQSTPAGQQVIGTAKASNPVKTGEDGTAGYFR